MVRDRRLSYSPQQPSALRAADRARSQRRAPATAGLVVSLLLFLAAWELLVLVRGYPPFILPSPSLVASRLAAELVGGTLVHHARLTIGAAAGGFALALSVSLVLGYALAHLPWLERIIAPQLAATQAVPVVAVAPLIILWVGTGTEARVLVAALVTFFPILSATVAGLRAVPRELIEMAHISGATRLQLLRLVELPLALPGIFVGVKAGLALATTGAVVGEFVGGRDGLGALINIARGLFDTPLMFAALVVLATVTLLFYLAAVLLERALVRWEY
jgi:NitT/TauT family transport system permease protein